METSMKMLRKTDTAYLVPIRIKVKVENIYRETRTHINEKLLVIPEIYIDKKNLLRSVLLKRTKINFEEMIERDRVRENPRRDATAYYSLDFRQRD
jgi:non-ribosomal peptide synthetase component F